MMGVTATKAGGFPDLITVKEAAALLRLKPYSMWEAIREGRIPHTRLGRRIYVLKDELAKQLRAAIEMPKTGGKSK
jgi:excisionase family DNA binding protein